MPPIGRQSGRSLEISQDHSSEFIEKGSGGRLSPKTFKENGALSDPVEISLTGGDSSFQAGVSFTDKPALEPMGENLLGQSPKAEKTPDFFLDQPPVLVKLQQSAANNPLTPVQKNPDPSKDQSMSQGLKTYHGDSESLMLVSMVGMSWLRFLMKGKGKKKPKQLPPASEESSKTPVEIKKARQTIDGMKKPYQEWQGGSSGVLRKFINWFGTYKKPQNSTPVEHFPELNPFRLKKYEIIARREGLAYDLVMSRVLKNADPEVVEAWLNQEFPNNTKAQVEWILRSKVPGGAPLLVRYLRETAGQIDLSKSDKIKRVLVELHSKQKTLWTWIEDIVSGKETIFAIPELAKAIGKVEGHTIAAEILLKLENEDHLLSEKKKADNISPEEDAFLDSLNYLVSSKRFRANLTLEMIMSGQYDLGLIIPRVNELLDMNPRDGLSLFWLEYMRESGVLNMRLARELGVDQTIDLKFQELLATNANFANLIKELDREVNEVLQTPPTEKINDDLLSKIKIYGSLGQDRAENALRLLDHLSNRADLANWERVKLSRTFLGLLEKEKAWEVIKDLLTQPDFETKESMPLKGNLAKLLFELGRSKEAKEVLHRIFDAYSNWNNFIGIDFAQELFSLGEKDLSRKIAQKLLRDRRVDFRAAELLDKLDPGWDKFIWQTEVTKFGPYR